MCMNVGPTMTASDSLKVKMTLFRGEFVVVKDEPFPNPTNARAYRDKFLPGATGYIKSASGVIIEYIC